MILLVGESANRRRTWQEDVSLMWVPHEELAKLLLSWGAFAHGCRYSELGMSWDASLNLLPPGEPWDKSLARETASQVLRYSNPRLLLLAGRRVATAFGVQGELPQLSGKFLALPHPSGRCRQWNDPETAEKCAELWQRASINAGRESLERLRALQ